ncbi:MAG: hypothetical protein HY674_08650 [Chloroflexi bacterium]|nr:hypothetical protein [Chloroflexota bacterium]
MKPTSNWFFAHFLTGLRVAESRFMDPRKSWERSGQSWMTLDSGPALMAVAEPCPLLLGRT